MRVYILADMEGISGIVRSEQVSGSGNEYEEARYLLTRDVNAAVEGALEGGATEVIVNDLHGARGGCNIVPEELHPEAKYIWGHTRWRLGLLDLGFDCAFMVGYHAMAGTEDGVLSHTFSSRSIYRVIINGREVGEIGIDAAILGCKGIPVALITGCKRAVEEAREFLGGNIEAAIVKEGLSRTDALCLAPAKARAIIKEAARRAVNRASELKPFTFRRPVEVIVEYMHPHFAEPIAKMPQVKRLGPRTIKVVSDDFLKVARLLGWY